MTASAELSLRLRDGTAIVVPASLNSMTAYVILEQEAWFEKEMVSPFMAVPNMVRSLTTNLQKQMDDDEIATLASFDQISISIDTADAKLLREIRGKSELRNVTTNLMKIRGVRIKHRKRQQSVRFNVVVTNRNALVLLDLAAYAVACGVDGMMLIQLNQSDFFNNDNVVQSISQLNDADFSEFVRQVEASRDLMQWHRKEFLITGYLESYIRGRVGGSKDQGLRIRPGQTRVCPQLWTYAVVKEDGRLSHCCANMMSSKSLRGSTFAEIVEDEEIRSWRESLLSGRNLPDACVTCHWAPGGRLTISCRF